MWRSSSRTETAMHEKASSAHTIHSAARTGLPDMTDARLTSPPMPSAALQGALWMTGAVLSFCVMAAAVRELLQHMGALEVLFWRVAAALALLLAVLPRTGIAPLRTRRIGLHFTRNGFHFFAQLAWIYA